VKSQKLTVILLTLLVLGWPLLAEARTWTVNVDAQLDATPFHVGFSVELPDPVGSATVMVGAIPVTVSHDADKVSLSLNTTLPLGCIVTVFGAGSAYINTGTGNSVASGPLRGNQVQSCSSGGDVVLLGLSEISIPVDFSDSDVSLVLLVPVYGTTGGETVVLNSAISGMFTASAVGVTPAAAPTAVSGPVTVKTPLGASPLTPGTDLTQGLFIETGGTGSATIVFRDASRLVVSPNTQVTLPPLVDAITAPAAVTLIKGSVRAVTGDAAPAGTPHTAVNTAFGAVKPIGTDFSVQYSQNNNLGTTVVTVDQGLVEVRNRLGQLFSVTAAAHRATFEDSVPRVLPVLPVDGGGVVAGRNNTFMWTAFQASMKPAYLLEFTGRPTGFTTPNAPRPESGSILISVPALFPQASGLIEFSLAVPASMHAGTPVKWRVFPVDATTGQVLPGVVASDTYTLIVR
jgi:hypothetical protein